MIEIFAAAQSVGLAGLAILVAALAVWLALKIVGLVRNGKNGNRATLNGEVLRELLKQFTELRLICPLSPGKRSMDDLYEVLVEVRNGNQRVNEKQTELFAESNTRARCLEALLNDLRVEIAEGRGRGIA